MNNKILTITIFVSNIAFGAVLNIDIPNNHIESKKVNKLSSQIVQNLSNRGLDMNIAKQKLSKSLKGSEYRNNLIIENILKEFPKITKKEIIEYISNSILMEKTIDLNSYGTIIGIIQKSTLNLNKDMYAKVQKIYNKNISIVNL